MQEFKKDDLSIARPNSRRKARGNSLWGRLVAFAALAATLASLAYLIEMLTYENYVRDRKLQVSVELLQVAKRMEGKIYEHILNISELATEIGQDPDMNRTAFNLEAVDYVRAHPDAVYVAIAPKNVVTMAFPSQGNEHVIGQDLSDITLPSPVVPQPSTAQEGLVLSKAFQMPGAPAGLLLAKSVLSTTAEGTKNPWGSIVLVLDNSRFLASLAIDGLADRYDLVIRDLSRGGSGGPQIIMGDRTVLTQDPILLNFDLPIGQLQLAAIPNGGWPSHEPNSLWRIALEVILIAGFLIGLWHVARLADTRRAAERKLSMGIEALDHGFVMFDADRRLVAFNRKYKELAGGSGMVKIGSRYEDIVKGSLSEGLIPDAIGREDEWFREWAKRFEASQADHDTEREQVLADGRTIHAYDKPMPDGSFVGLRIDISALKKAQFAAEAANRAKTDFLGVLSHELRTPLTVILGQTKLAQNFQRLPEYHALIEQIDALPEGGEAVKATLEPVFAKILWMLSGMERSGNHLFTLISEILDFAKIESGTLTMDMEPTSADTIAEAVAEQMRQLIETKGLAFHVDVQALDLLGDEQRLRHVLINLIGNALKFTDEGAIWLSVSAEGNEVLFSVRDTGIGIPDDHLERIFGAFQQVDATSTRKYCGTGLGLAISKDIAEAHGGALTVTSTPGVGSVFTLRLPKAEPAIAAETPPAEALSLAS